MNLIRKVVLTLAVVIGLLSLVSLFLPAELHVERSLEIGAPPAMVFDQVNTLRNWKNWSHWDRIDPDMISSYEGPESGVGATHFWSSRHRSVGTGSMTITESTEPSSIATSLSFGGSRSQGGWRFEPTQGGTGVTIFMDMKFPFFGRIFPGLMMNEWLGKDFEEALNGLKAYCEALPEEQASAWNVEYVTTEATPALSIRILSDQARFSTKLGEAYTTILSLMQQQGLRQSGAAYAIYYRWSKDTVELEPGIPTDRAGVGDSLIRPTTFPKIRAIKVDYFGDYPGTEKVHAFMYGWCEKNGVTIEGAPWEEYVNYPPQDPDTSKWLTRVYYPVGE